MYKSKDRSTGDYNTCAPVYDIKTFVSSVLLKLLYA